MRSNLFSKKLFLAFFFLAITIISVMTIHVGINYALDKGIIDQIMKKVNNGSFVDYKSEIVTENKAIKLRKTQDNPFRLESSGEIETITLNDENLYNSIVEQIQNIAVFETDSDHLSIIISKNELEKITELTLNNNEISNISNLDKFEYLTELNISNNIIIDISCLSNLGELVVLKAYGNNISDITPLENLTNLKILNLSNNNIQDSSVKHNTSKLANLVNLEELNLSHNYIEYTDELGNLTKLKVLDLYNNNVHNLSGLNSLTDLEKLLLGENNEKQTGAISNLSVLNTLTNLKELDFSENKTSDIISNINHLTNLEYLSLEDNNITDIAGLSNLTNLKELILYTNNITDITPLFSLTNLENLVLGNNEITSIAGILNNNELRWTELRSIAINENPILPSNELQYLINKSINQEIEFNYEHITDTSNLPHIDSNGKKYITFEDFGARSNGTYDDFIAIRNAYNYANDTEIEIRSDGSKTYHIYDYYNKYLYIEANTDLNHSTIIIHDEEIENKSARNRYISTISNTIYSDKITINNPSWTINKSTKKLNLGDALKDKEYKKFFVYVENANKKQFIRYRTNGISSSGYNQLDIFEIDSEGNILNDITWDFDSITSITIFPINEDKLSIKNINFITNNITSRSDTNDNFNNKTAYLKRNIQLFTAFNVDLIGINHSMLRDEVSGSYIGFIFVNRAADLTIKDCNFFAHKYIDRFCYDFYLNYAVNVVFDNVNINDFKNLERWHAIVSRFSKDVVYKNCKLNVVDAHEGVYNLTIQDSEIGPRDIEVDGFGTLNIINTKIYSCELVHLKEDYGSFWDGTIYIKDSTLVYQPPYGEALISFSTEVENNHLHDYGYDLVYPNIVVENLTVDNTNNYRDGYLWGVPNWNTETNPFISDTYFRNDLLINGVQFKNSHFDNPQVKIFVHEINQLKGNYVVTDLSLRNEEEDLTSYFNLNKGIISTSNVSLNIKPQSSSKNIVSIYKDNNLIVENTTISNNYDYTFTENGIYTIKLTSIDYIYNRSSIKEYQFELQKAIEVNNDTEDINNQTTNNNTTIMKNRTDDDNNTISNTSNTSNAIHILDGKNQLYYVDYGKDLIIKIDADYNSFRNNGKIYIDENEIAKKYYVVKEGTSIVLLNDYLKDYEEGTHTITISLDDKEAKTVFNIYKTKSTTDDTTIKTNDTNTIPSKKSNSAKLNIIQISAVFIVCLLIVLFIIKIVKRKK